MKKIALTFSLLLSLAILSKHSVGTVNNHPASMQSMPSEQDSSFSAEEYSIQQYLTAHKLTATITSSGLYYVVESQGFGKKVKKGKKVTVNYTGSLLNGKKFDSTTDTAFHHVAPFPFIIGQGHVIKGWDEGIALFNVGGKGKLIIPSALAYGTKGAGDVIPPNSVLVFDIEVLKVNRGGK